MDINGLRSFVALADDLSFTHTAARLGIPQPRLSLRIRALEDRLGFRVFDRTSRRVSLTSHGATILPRARELIAMIDRLEHDARKIRYAAGSTVTIGAVDYARPLKRRILGRFMKEHPTVAVEIETTRSVADIFERLVSGAWDLAMILEGEHQVVPPDFESLFLARMPMGLLLPDQGAREIEALPPDFLAGKRVAIFRREASPALYDRLEDILFSAGAKLSGLPEASQTGLVDFVRETGFAAICAKWWHKPGDGPVGLTHVPLTGHDLALNWMLVRKRGGVTRAADQFWKVARRQAGLDQASQDRES